jgi:basic membrane protein A
MKKLLFMFSIWFLLVLVACGGSSGKKTEKKEAPLYEVALITDSVSGAIDDRSFTQGAWDGIKQYCDETGKAGLYYRATEESKDGYLNAIQMAVDNGAQIVVCPGYLYESAVFFAQDIYPKVQFLLLDGVPQNGEYTEYKTANNTYSIVFAEEQAGFLAGYAAVLDGYRHLGFMGGMAVPAVVKFGYGYLQGANYAAKEMGLAAGEVQVNYGYTGNFAPTPENQTKAASWYQSGTEVIFSCGGLIMNSVTAAAEVAGIGAAVIGVDVDQKGESETVITSAMKNLTVAVYNGLKMAYSGNFPGGVNARLGAAEDCVGLPDDYSRFHKFTREQYNGIYAKLKADDGGLASAMMTNSLNGENVTLQQITARTPLLAVKDMK